MNKDAPTNTKKFKSENEEEDPQAKLNRLIIHMTANTIRNLSALISCAPDPDGKLVMAHKLLTEYIESKNNDRPQQQNAPSSSYQVLTGHPMFKKFQALPNFPKNNTDLSAVSIGDFSFLEILGTGSFGRVRLVRHKKTSEYFCLKILNKAKLVKMGQCEHARNERTVLSKVSGHPFIVQLYKTFQDQQNLYLLMSFIPGGELFNYIRTAGMLPEDVCRFYAAELVLALEYVHSLGIIYRDLKPENLLLDERGHIKMTDFGFAKFIFQEKTYSMCGTADYIAPEIIMNRGHSYSVDWWSLGTLIYEMLAGYPPFVDEVNSTIFEKILNAPISFPQHFSKEAVDIIRGLLNRNISARLGCSQGGTSTLKKHPWFASINWDMLEKCSEISPGPLNPNILKQGAHNYHQYRESDLPEEPPGPAESPFFAEF